MIRNYLDNQLRALWREALRHDFASFLQQSFTLLNQGQTYLPNWHLELIAEYLHLIEEGKLQRLIINMPPRYLKSICVSVAWPAWLLGHQPQKRIIAASYANSLSVKHSLDCRQLMQSGWYQRAFPETRLMQGQNEKHKFVTTENGFRLASSVGGALTGEGGDILILDDPLNPLQAESSTLRTVANRWFEHTFSSRLNDKRHGGIVLVMQRLHPQDLAGFLQEKGNWELLELPAIAPQTRYYDCRNMQHRRQEGAALHPQREDIPMLQRVQREMGSHIFEAQYQQRPIRAESQLIQRQWLQRYEILPQEMAAQQGARLVQSWDTGIKAGQQHDPSVCLTFACWEGGYYLLEARVERLEYPALRRAMLQQAESWQPEAIVIEDQASGQSLLQDLRQSTALPVVPFRPRHDKFTRFAVVTPMIEAGRLFLPQQAGWLGAFEQELLSFPQTTHDDQVDALSQFLHWVRKRDARGNARLRRV
jgi:predicted phage terminase large subunit-like protein